MYKRIRPLLQELALKALFVLSAFGLSFTPIQFASALPPTTPEVQAYMAQKYAEALAQQPQILANALQGDYLNPQDPPYQGGNLIIMIPIIMALDMVKHIIDFYGGGMRWDLIGLCKKCSIFGCSFYPYQEYHYPYEMVEIAGMFQGQYSPDLLLTLFRSLVEQFRYELMKELVPSEIQKTLDVAQGNFHIPFDDSDIPSVNGAVDAVEAQPSSRRMVWDILNPAGAQQRQYHFISPLAHTSSVPFAPLGNCHQRPDSGMNLRFPRSDNPLHIMQTHIQQFGDIFNPVAGAVMQFNPAICTGHNLASGVTQPSPFAPQYLPAPAKAFCLERLGPLYPIVTRMPSIRSFATGAPTAVLRGDSYFRTFEPSKADFAYYQYGNRKEDTLQWHFPDEWSDDPENKIADNTDFRDANYHGEVRNDGAGHSDDPFRAVGTIWKYIRCCPSGFSVLWGPKPQLKGLHDFPGDFG